jgi:ABC-2 type transport system permease protein
MIATIALKEFRDAWRDGRFRVAAVLVLGLLAVSLILAWQQVERIQAERAEAAGVERHNWLDQGEKNSHSAAHYGLYVFKPMAPLAVFDRGLEPFVGTSVFLEAHRQNAATGLPAQDATAMRRFGELTAAAATQLLAPLVIILLTFGALCGERQSGTLRQLMSLGVRPRELVFGKAIGLGAALLSLFIPGAIGGGIALAKLSGGEWAGGWSRFAWLTTSYGLYLLAVLGICLAVSVLCSTPRTALAILLGLWTANTVLAPRLASDYARWTEPTPSLVEFEKARDQELAEKGLVGHHPKGAWVQELQRATFSEFSDVQQARAVYAGRLMLALEERQAEVWGRHSAFSLDEPRRDGLQPSPPLPRGSGAAPTGVRARAQPVPDRQPPESAGARRQRRPRTLGEAAGVPACAAVEFDGPESRGTRTDRPGPLGGRSLGAPRLRRPSSQADVIDDHQHLPSRTAPPGA